MSARDNIYDEFERGLINRLPKSDQLNSTVEERQLMKQMLDLKRKVARDRKELIHLNQRKQQDREKLNRVNESQQFPSTSNQHEMSELRNKAASLRDRLQRNMHQELKLNRRMNRNRRILERVTTDYWQYSL